MNWPNIISHTLFFALGGFAVWYWREKIAPDYLKIHAEVIEAWAQEVARLRADIRTILDALKK